MSAAEMLARVRALGIVLSNDHGRLLYEAPVGALTADLRQSLKALKPAILDLLESEGEDRRGVVRCEQCVHHIPAPPIHRGNGAIWEMPGGCAEGLTTPDSKPPIYPFTGWYCKAWTARKVQ